MKHNLLTDTDLLNLVISHGMTVNVDWAKLKVSVFDGRSNWFTEELSTDSINADIDPYVATRKAIEKAAESTKDVLNQ